MTHRMAIQRISRHIPTWLRALRGRMVLDPYVERMGLEEVECPACGGSGWLDAASLERCPACCGFERVPQSLAQWVAEELRSPRRNTPRGTGRREGAVPPRGENRHNVSSWDVGLSVLTFLQDDPREQGG